MQFGADGMKKQSRVVLEKKRFCAKKRNYMEGVECTISASVTAQIVVVDIPIENIKISIPTKELLTVMNAANEKYQALRRQEMAKSDGSVGEGDESSLKVSGK
ncbi:MAG: hypothetical protein HDR14_00865 [Lachnospiraceae bacterium]|nr:hypothetical protein [Lachnospiraceae bacterium]